MTSLLQIEMMFRSLWTFLSAGSPSMAVILCAVNGVFLAIFLLARAYFQPHIYNQHIRRSIHILMATANMYAIFHRDLNPILHDAFLPYRDLIDQII